MHVCHLITGLGMGGTPVLLREVLRRLQHRDVRFSAISLIDDLEIGRDLETQGVPVHSLGLKRGAWDPRGLWRLIRLLRRDPPDLLQTWLYHADLLGLLAAPWCGRPPVVWNIRHATLTPGVDSRSTRWTAAACARLSHRGPRAIVVNSRSGQDVHIRAGYNARRFAWIPNGFDLQRLRPSPEARTALRQELGLPPETPLVGLAARFSRLKGHDLFIRAMAHVARVHPTVHFVLCGRGTDAANQELTAMLASRGAADRWRLLGPRSDMPRIHAALDIEVCPSVSEAFSNSLGEALACGTPCIATDVGDSAEIVGDAGAVVPAGDADALAHATQRLLELPAEARAELSQRARRRIAERFDINAVADRYLQLWTEIHSGRGAPLGAAGPFPAAAPQQAPQRRAA